MSRSGGVIGAAMMMIASASVSVAAQSLPAAFESPWSDVAPAIVEDRVVAAGLGLPDERLGRLSARRAAARSRGEERAETAIHAWADDALARVSAAPTVAADVHRVIDARAEVTRVRALADGGAVVEIAVPLAALREVSSERGLPWSR
ncbi:hypothetical protein [Sandaracinus amylolyticus]|uniref:Uncharacterized protein n=1 Tax=Sandaracinus amylolyticus TaxID=927083 RepID=A0A0F6W7T8_9BACT|nr:hypothetical protein [Sandaracinus amylolyticus]AKF09490.1 hypothetical protein DB32_006639 [Sandaracinus amylolyticus]